MQVLSHGDPCSAEELEEVMDNLGADFILPCICQKARGVHVRIPGRSFLFLSVLILVSEKDLSIAGMYIQSRQHLNVRCGICCADQYRESVGADATEGVLEMSDFLLVTFDYYLAMGKARMRALYCDLILT